MDHGMRVLPSIMVVLSRESWKPKSGSQKILRFYQTIVGK